MAKTDLRLVGNRDHRDILRWVDGQIQEDTGKAEYLARVRDVRDGFESLDTIPYGARKNNRKRLAEPGRDRLFTNSAKVLFGAVVRILSAGGQPNYRMPRSVEDATEFSAMNKQERMALGIHRSLDRWAQSQGFEGLVQMLANYVAQGHWVIMPWITTNPWNGQPEFRADVPDPIEVYTSHGPWGIHKTARIWRVTTGTLRELVNEPGWTRDELDARMRGLGVAAQDNSGGPQVLHELVTYWEKVQNKKGATSQFTVYHGIFLKANGKEIQKYEATDFPDILMKSGVVNGYPERAYKVKGRALQRTSTGTTGGATQGTGFGTRHWSRFSGRSVIDDNLELYTQLDKALSLVVDNISMRANGQVFIHTDSGELPFTEDDYGKSFVIPLKSTDKVTELTSDPTPESVNIVINALIKMIDRGGLPPLAMGDIDAKVSGFLLFQVLQQVRSILAPQIQAMKVALTGMMEMLFTMYKNGNFADVELDVQAKMGAPETSYFVEKFTKDDVVSGFLDVKLQISVADETMQRAEIARSLQGTVSQRTIWENVLHDWVPDPNLEAQRFSEDQAMALPEVQASLAIETLMDQADALDEQAEEEEDEKKKARLTRKAEGKRRASDRVAASLEAQITQNGLGGSGTAQRAADLNAEDEPRGGTPEAAAATGLNADVVRAVVGEGTPAPGGGPNQQPVTQRAVRERRIATG